MSAIALLGMKLTKHAPKILFWGGMTLGVGGTVWACISSTKVKGKVDEFKKDMNEIKQREEDLEILPKEAFKEKSKRRSKFLWDMTKLYGPPVILLGGGGACLVASTGMLSRRVAGFAAAASSSAAAFETYRQKVKDRYGEDVDREFLLNQETKTFQKETVGEDGLITTEEITAPVALLTGEDTFTLIFDKEHSEIAGSDPRDNLTKVSLRERYFNDRLKARKRFTKDEMLDELGFTNELNPELENDPTVLIQGWRYMKDNPKGDNCVNLNAKIEWIEDMHTGRLREAVVLRPNYDGDIYDIAPKKKAKEK